MKNTNPEREHDARGAGTTATVTDLDAVRRSRRTGSSNGEPATPSIDETSAASDATAAMARGKKPRRAPNRRFDREKVERLKAEIAAGRYEIDHERVAAKFIEYDAS